MSETPRKRGRPNKHRAYDDLLASCPKEGMRRPSYLNGIGVRRGARGDTLWIKIQIDKKPVSWQGKVYKPGQAIEHKLGNLHSFTWEEAIAARDEMQRRVDRGEPLEDAPAMTFREWAEDWLERKKGTISNWKREEGLLKKHFYPAYGDYLLDDLTTADIERWVALKRREMLSPGYINRILNTVRSVLNDAVEKSQTCLAR